MTIELLYDVTYNEYISWSCAVPFPIDHIASAVIDSTTPQDIYIHRFTDQDVVSKYDLL